MDLRKQFWQTIYELAERDKKVIVLTGDLGFSFCEPFQQKFPKQFINCGIAECNMIGVAAGLAIGGFKPYVYSNAIFLLSRAHEFVRNEICYNNLNVKLCGTGAGSFLGFSHNLGKLESEKNWLKGMPNIKLYFPKNEKELKQAMIKNYKLKSPSYVRI